MIRGAHVADDRGRCRPTSARGLFRDGRASRGAGASDGRRRQAARSGSTTAKRPARRFPHVHVHIVPRLGERRRRQRAHHLPGGDATRRSRRLGRRFERPSRDATSPARPSPQSDRPRTRRRPRAGSRAAISTTRPAATLFERITEQPEYYLTRVEARLLARCTRATSRALAGPVDARRARRRHRRGRRASCSRRGRCTAHALRARRHLRRHARRRPPTALAAEFARLAVERARVRATSRRSPRLARAVAADAVSSRQLSLGNLNPAEQDELFATLADALRRRRPRAPRPRPREGPGRRSTPRTTTPRASRRRSRRTSSCA